MKSLLKYILAVFCLFAIKLEAQNGLVKSYYPNGNLESAIFYVNDILDGTSRYFYENGVLKEETTYSMGILNGWVKTYYENGAPKNEFHVKQGRMDGVAKEFYNNGGLKIFSIYEDGILKQKQLIEFDSTLAPPSKANIRSLANTNEQIKKINGGTANNKSLPEPVEAIIKSNSKEKPSDVFYTSVDEFPRPLGGPSEVYSRTVYPEAAKLNKVEGIVIIRAFIDEDGNVTKTEIVKGIGSGCDEAAVEAIRSTKFSSPKKKGSNVKCQTLIPVKFKVE